MDGKLHASAVLPPGKRAGTRRTGRWVGRRADVDGYGKSRPLLGSDPRTVHPVPRRHTDYAIPAHEPNKTKNSCSCNNLLGAAIMVTCAGRHKWPLLHRWMTHVSGTSVDLLPVIQLHKVQADTLLCREVLKRR